MPVTNLLLTRYYDRLLLKPNSESAETDIVFDWDMVGQNKIKS